MSSTLSNGDRSFIEFTRCLYKAKSVVLELQEFSKTLSCATRQGYDPRISTDEFIKHVNRYLQESFRKFNNMCRVLLIILTKMEVNQPVQRERINSFRHEVLQEWEKADKVRQELLYLVKDDSYRVFILPSPQSNDDDDSETSVEPRSSEE